MNIPFSRPVIDQDVINEVNDTLINTGWLTTGPKVKALEEELQAFTQSAKVACVNSWVSGAMLVLRWFGIKQGDEIIIPAYTYSATALAIMNIGAVPVMVDVNEDFNINVSNIKAAVTARTKAIIPVDIGGWPCDYDQIMQLVSSPDIRQLFEPATERQSKLGRMLVLTDAAHSIGSNYNGKPAATITDVAIFSFHSVKNITTGEGGAVCLNLPAPFSNADEYQFLKKNSINGQTKSAFEKNQLGGWRYDIIDQGLKVNMPDICAAIGLAQIRKYKNTLLPERKRLYEHYNASFKKFEWAQLPPFDNALKTSSYHLYLLRINKITETQRDKMITLIAEKGVAVNVHYIPMAMLTLFKNKGFNIGNYPVTYDNYAREITLPLYNNLTIEQLDYVVNVIDQAYQATIKL